VVDAPISGRIEIFKLSTQPFPLYFKKKVFLSALKGKVSGLKGGLMKIIFIQNKGIKK